MNEAAYDAAEKYDKLLNKYYKLLLATLEQEDKQKLIDAQRAWIVFMDKELELNSILREDEYSGGGTIQSLIYSSAYLDIIKRRAIEIFQYYEGVFKME